MQLFRIVLLFILLSALAGCNEHSEPVVQQEEAPSIPVPELVAPPEVKKIVGGSSDGC